MTTPRITPISNPADPRVREYLSLKEGDLHRGIDPSAPNGCFICEGHFVVQHLLASDYTCRSILVSETKIETYADLLAAAPAEVPIYSTSEETMSRLLGFKFHRGILASGIRKPPATQPEIETLLRAAPAAIVLENLTNVDNVGGIFRCASALCPPNTAVILSPECCDPLYRKSIRVSMGHALCVPFATLNPWSLDIFQAAGFATIALTPSPDATDINKCRSALGNKKPALLLGAEGPGLDNTTLAKADIRCRIPQRAGVDSLNVMVAAAIAMSVLIEPLE